MIFLNRETEMYAFRKTFKEMNEFIITKRAEGYFISDFDFGSSTYSVVLEKTNEIHDQFLWWSKSFDREKVIELWDKGHRLTHVFNDGFDWIYVFSKLKTQFAQGYVIGPEFPQNEIQKYWNDGFGISKVAFGEGKWLVVFSKDMRYNHGWCLRTKIDIDEIRKWVAEGKIITNLVWSGEKWALTFGKHEYYTYQIIESHSVFPAEGIKKRWDDGYSLTLCAFGENLWYTAFSANNKEKVLLNEQNRMVRENQGVKEKLELLYNEKKHSEVINLFEKNGFLAEDEKTVGYYLWSLWLNDGTEEKAFNLCSEFSGKLNSSKWDIIKGHYCKWKKWYDLALDYYKGTSESDYNKVLTVFEEFNKLYLEKKHQEAITYFQNNLTSSVSEKHLNIAERYLWALFLNNGTENLAYDSLKEFKDKFPNNDVFNLVGGYIKKWIGEKNSDVKELEESIVLFKSVNDSEEVEKCRYAISQIKQKVKNDIRRLKIAERENEKVLKQKEKELEKAKKEEEKRKRKEEELGQHKLKSARGEIYCMFCGRLKSRTVIDDYCPGRVNGHNYVFMKDKKDRWELHCNKCGSSTSYSHYGCN